MPYKSSKHSEGHGSEHSDCKQEVFGAKQKPFSLFCDNLQKHQTSFKAYYTPCTVQYTVYTAVYMLYSKHYYTVTLLLLQ